MELPTLPANPTSKLLFPPLNFTGVFPRLKLANKWEVYKISPDPNPSIYPLPLPPPAHLDFFWSYSPITAMGYLPFTYQFKCAFN